VVGCAQHYLIVQESSEFFGKLRGKLGTSVQDGFIIESEVFENIFVEKMSHAFSHYHFLAK
jgi:hypothetical protein